MSEKQERPEKKPAYKILISHLRHHAKKVSESRLRDGGVVTPLVMMSSSITMLIIQVMYHMKEIPDDCRQEICDELRSIATECVYFPLVEEITKLADQISKEVQMEEFYILVFEDNQQELVCPNLYTDKEKAEEDRDKWNADILACAARVSIVVPL